ncbi:MAG TPA: hypothetical protein VF975_10635 [Thermoanaerobaculia bacterium]
MFPNPQEALPLSRRPTLQHYQKLAKDLVKARKSTDPDEIRNWAAKWPSIRDEITEFIRSRMSRTNGTALGHAETVKLLLERGAPIDQQDETYDGTPLGWALYAWATRTDQPDRESYYEVVALLIRAGTKPDREWIEGSMQRIAEKIKADPRMREALGLEHR